MSGSSPTRLNSIILGEVASVQAYGAFIKIPGSSDQGLVHRSQISKVNVPDVSEVLSKGDRVWCKIISTTDDGKIGLSMKVVDQGNGHDLDPNGVQIQLDEQRRKEWVPGGKQKTISLEAVYNTTCGKCGTRGHLGKDCFQVAGGKTYELLPAEEQEATQVSDSHNTAMLEALKEKLEKKRLKKEAKKERKEAKKKKKAEKKAAKKLKKKLKKEAKKTKKETNKKRRHSSSDSDDSSDSSSSSSSSSGNDSDADSKSKPHRDKSHNKDSDKRYPVDRKRLRSRSRSPRREDNMSRTDSRLKDERITSLEDRRRMKR